MKKLALSIGFLCCCCGLASASLAPFAWLGWCGMASLDSAYDGTALIFRIIFEGHNLQGISLLSMSFSQLPSEIVNLNVVGLFCVVGPRPLLLRCDSLV